MRYVLTIISIFVILYSTYAQPEGLKPKYAVAFTLGYTSLSNTSLRSTENYFDLVDDVVGGLSVNFIFNYYFNDKWGAELNYLTSSYTAHNEFNNLVIKYPNYNLSSSLYGFNISSVNLGIIRRYHLSKFAFEPEFVLGYSYVNPYLPDVKLKKIGYNEMILLNNHSINKKGSVNLGLVITAKYNVKRRIGFFLRLGMLWNNVNVKYTTETVYSNRNRVYNNYEINNLVGNFSINMGVYWNIVRAKFEAKTKNIQPSEFISE